MKYGFLIVTKPVDDYLDYAKEHGFKHLEIDLIKDHQWLETFDSERIKKLNTLAQKNKISLSLHAPYTINPAERLPILKKAQVEYYKQAIVLASKLNATHITAHLGYFIGEKNERQIFLNSLLDSLKKIVEFAKEKRITIAVENLHPMPKGSGIILLCACIPDLLYIFSNLSSPFLKMCLDTGHAHTAEGLEEYLNRLKDNIICMHVHDNLKKADDHLPVGEGTINWSNFATSLKKMRFVGPLILEVPGKKPHLAKIDLQKYFPE